MARRKVKRPEDERMPPCIRCDQFTKFLASRLPKASMVPHVLRGRRPKAVREFLQNVEREMLHTKNPSTLICFDAVMTPEQAKKLMSCILAVCTLKKLKVASMDYASGFIYRGEEIHNERLNKVAIYFQPRE